MFGLGRKYGFFVMVLGAAILLAPVPAFADGAFGGLIASGREIFTGLREIIYPGIRRRHYCRLYRRLFRKYQLEMVDCDYSGAGCYQFVRGICFHVCSGRG